MKKVLIPLLTIFCFYGFNTVKAESEEPKLNEEQVTEAKTTEAEVVAEAKSDEEQVAETKSTEEKVTEAKLSEEEVTEAKSTEEKATEPKLSEEEITEALMMVTIGKGIVSNLMDSFCNRGLTDLEFNGKKYSSIQTLYKEETSTNTQKFIKDSSLNNSSDCDYNKEICNEKSEPNFGFIYEKISVDNNNIYFYSYHSKLSYNPSSLLIRDFNSRTDLKPNTMFIINRTNKTVSLSTFSDVLFLDYNQVCKFYKRSLKIRHNTLKMKDIKIEKRAEKEEDPIEVNGQKFDVLSTKISYTSDITSSDNIKLASPVVQTETSWTADSGELKGFGVKHLLTRQACKTYTDTVTLSGITKETECKSVVDEFRSIQMVDYQFTRE